MDKEISYSDFVKQQKKMLSDGSWNTWLLFILYYFGVTMNIIRSDGMYDFRNVHFTNKEIDILSELVDEAIRDNKFDLSTLACLQKGFKSLKDNNSYHGFVESF